MKMISLQGCAALVLAMGIVGCGDPKQAEANDEMEKALLQNEERVKAEVAKVTNERFFALRNQRGREAKEANDRIARDLKIKADAVERIERVERSRIGNLQDFAIKEADAVWKTRQCFLAELDVIDEKLERAKDMSKTEDKSILALNKLRNSLVRRVRTIERKLEMAYATKMKYEANPNDKALAGELQNQLLDCSLYEERERKAYEAQRKGVAR